MTNTGFLRIKLFCQSFCISTCLDFGHPEHHGANAQNTYRRIHKSYCSRSIHAKRCYAGISGHPEGSTPGHPGAFVTAAVTNTC